MIVPYREIAPPPSDETAALTLIRSVIEQHVGRLEELLAEHEEIEADEAAERYDRAAGLQPGIRAAPPLPVRPAPRAAEDAGHAGRMRNAECGMGNREEEMADGKCQMANGKCQMANGKCQMADDGGRMADDHGEVGGCE